jgi:hypothetical protein
MKKLLPLLILAPALVMAQDFSPSLNSSFDLILDYNLMEYNRITNIDPLAQPVDTFGRNDIMRDANNNYTQGREWRNDTLVSVWLCSAVNGLNTVYLTDPLNGDTLQMDKVYRDANMRDTLIEVFADTLGNGQLSLIEKYSFYFNASKLDSCNFIDYGSGGGDEINYTYFRDTAGDPDSLVITILFAGMKIPVQTFLYNFGVNGLESIDLKDLTGAIDLRITVTLNANGEISDFHLNEKDANNEWIIFESYFLSIETFFGIDEAQQDFDFSFFPNPAQDYLQFDLPEISQYQLVNLSGQIALEGSISGNQKIDITGLKPGIYLLSLRLENGKLSSKRLVKD